MNRSPKARIAVGVLAVILGLGGVYSLVRFVRTSEERALAGQELVEVYLVQEPIRAGTPAAELGPFVETATVPAQARPDDAVTDLAALGELVTDVDLVPGEELIASRFVSPHARTVAGSQIPVPDGLLEVTILTSAERAVGGQVQPGELVSVVASFDDTTVEDADGIPVAATQPIGDTLTVDLGQSGPKTRLLIRKALVTNIQATTPEVFADEEQTDRSREAPAVDLLVTLAVAAPDLERLVFTKEYGTIWLARDPLLAPSSATDVVSFVNIFDESAVVDATTDSVAFAADEQGEPGPVEPTSGEPDATTPPEEEQP